MIGGAGDHDLAPVRLCTVNERAKGLPMGQHRTCKRILLKLSGEALKGDGPQGLDPEAIARIAARVKEVVATGIEVAVVVGGGNFFRGFTASSKGNITRTTADSIGMLATLMNGLALRDGFADTGMHCILQSSFAIAGVAPAFDATAARDALSNGGVLIFAGGTGHPYFTTDTTAALRACEIRADALVKATKVDGVYSADPHLDPNARRYRSLAYADALQQRLGVIDSTAFSLCMDNRVPIIVFNFAEPHGLLNVTRGDMTKATLVGDVETVEG